MTRDENLERLRGATIGRVAVSVQALPHVFLAPIALDELEDEDPVVLVTLNRSLSNPSSLDHVVVAVHTDGTDPGGAHWEVLVQGVSSLPGRGPNHDGEPYRASVGTELIRGWRTYPT